MRKVGLIAVGLVLAAALTGCGTPPKATLGKAFENFEKMESYQFQAKMTLGGEVPADKLGDAQAEQVANLLKNAEMSFSGVYQKEPFQSEINVQLNLKGDLNVGINLPIVMTKEKMWVKIPNIPFLPLPKTVTDKYLELDLKELEEKSSGQKQPDMTKGTEFAKEVMAAFVQNFDEKTYFTELNKKEITLPAGVEANRFVQIQVDKNNLDDAIKVSIGKVIPKIFDLLLDPKYADLFNAKKADIEKARSEFTDKTKDQDKVLNDIKKNVDVNQIQLISGINKSNFITYQTFKVDLNVKDESGNSHTVVNVESTMDHINEKAQFKLGIPTSDNIITEEQLQKEFAKGFMQ
ncbi:hypothetical protein ABE504_22480 [Paenibacillus oryzisoli]|uniref:hypothetical protein n=1 Tax=Paenibacillus oryzisoli TaxID=1850517 RepID=UPI003D2A8A44